MTHLRILKYEPLASISCPFFFQVAAEGPQDRRTAAAERGARAAPLVARFESLSACGPSRNQGNGGAVRGFFFGLVNGSNSQQMLSFPRFSGNRDELYDELVFYSEKLDMELNFSRTQL